MRYIQSVIIALLCVVATNSKATHQFGGHINWKSVGKDSFEIEVVTYKDCSNRSFDKLSVRAQSNCGSRTLSPTKVTRSNFTPNCSKLPTCTTAATGKSLGVQKITSTYLLLVGDWRKNGCCEFVIYATTEARNKRINTIVKDTTRALITSKVNFCQNTGQTNFWTETGAFQAPIGKDFKKRIKLNTSDTTDSIVYSLTTPQTQKGAIKYSGSYRYQAPLFFLGFPKTSRSWPAGFHLNSQNGTLEFRPMKSEIALIAVKANIFRSGKLIGTTTTEFTIFAYKPSTTSSAPKISGINGFLPDSNYSFCNKWKNCIYIVSNGASVNDKVNLSYVSNLPPDAIITQRSSAPNVDTLQICWTPDTSKYAAAGYFIQLTSKYDACPVLDSSTKTFYFDVSTPARERPKIQVKRLNCDSFKVELDSTRNIPILWNLNGIDTAIGSPSWILHAKQKGDYRIKATLDNCNLEEAHDTVKVYALNDAQIKLSVKGALCQGDTLSVKADVQNAGTRVEYSWLYNKAEANLIRQSTNELLLTYKNHGRKEIEVIVIDKSEDSLGCLTQARLIHRAREKDYKQLFNTLHCSADAFPSPIQLPIHDTISGWQGAGIENDVFDWKKLPGFGNYELKYQIVDGDTGACVHYTAMARYHKSPVVSIGEKKFTICKNGTGKALSAQPIGGYWHGRGIDGPFFKPNQAGIGIHPLVYTITDTVNGCKANDTTLAEVIHRKPDITIPASITLCGNAEPVTINAQPSGGFWTSPQFKSVGNSIYIDPAVINRAGSYSITYKFEDSLQCSNIEGTTVHITTYSKARFYLEESEVFVHDTIPVVNTSVIQNNTHFRWTVGKPVVSSSNALNPILTVEDTGYFDIKLSTTDLVSSCIDSMRIKKAIYVKEPTVKSIKEMSREVSFAPNPAKEVVNISCTSHNGFYGRLTDLNGRILIEFSSISKQGQINVSNVARGTYLLSISTSNGNAQHKIVITH